MKKIFDVLPTSLDNKYEPKCRIEDDDKLKVTITTKNTPFQKKDNPNSEYFFYSINNTEDEKIEEFEALKIDDSFQYTFSLALPTDKLKGKENKIIVKTIDQKFEKIALIDIKFNSNSDESGSQLLEQGKIIGESDAQIIERLKILENRVSIIEKLILKN